MSIYTKQQKFNQEDSSQHLYCVYLTVYSGNKLPIFYIGRVKIEKIIKHNYNGTVGSEKYKKIWKQERKQNPHLFKTYILKTFFTDKECSDYEYYVHKHFNVRQNELYTNLHNHKQKFYKNGPMSKEHKQKISKARMGYVPSEDTRKLWSKIRKGTPAWNKGIPQDDTNKKRISETLKKAKRKWYNDGVNNYITNDPHPSWNIGRIMLQYTCPNCNKTDSFLAMMRYHVNKCHDPNNNNDF